MLKNKSCLSFLIVFTFISIFSFSISIVNAQIPKDVKSNLNIPDSKQVQIITTYDKSTLIGRIVKIGEQEIQFKTEFGEITIPIQKIKSVEVVPISSIKGGIYWFPNPNATRLYFAPTARMLKQGEGYFSDYYLFFPGISYGITDNVTIGGGISLIPWIGIDKQLFYFTPKVGLKATKNFNFATGALIIKVPDSSDDDSPIVGILYGVSTFGTPDGSITAGIGYGFVGSDLAEKPMFMIGGEKRLSRRMAFVTENWILPGVDQPLISYGMRFMGEKMSFDLALWNILSEDIFFPGMPYVDFVFNF